jgi:hypothetical protein
VRIATSNGRFVLLEIALWAIVLAFVLFSLRPALFAGVNTFAHDNLYWGFPLYRFYVEEVLSNRFGLWNPFSHGGESLITAYLQLRLFDPISAITAKFVGMFTDGITEMFSWDRVVRIYVGCIGAYLVIRDAVTSRLARLALIPVAGLSSMALDSLHQNALPDQFYCAVFAIYFLMRILEREDYRCRNWVGVAIFFGASIQSYWFTGGTLAFIWILLGVLLYRRQKFHAIFAHRGNLLRIAMAVIIVSVMAIPMFVYLFQLSGDLYYSARFLPSGWAGMLPKGGPFDDIRGYDPDAPNSFRMPYAVIAMTGTNLSFSDFLTLWTGLRFLRAGEAALFIGALPFAISLLGMVAGKHSAKRVWMVFLIGMSFVGLGRDGGVHNVLYYVLPPLWFVRHTHAMSPFILLALLFFFAIGFQHLLQLLRSRNAGRLVRHLRERVAGKSVVGIIVGEQGTAGGRREAAPRWFSIALLSSVLAALVAVSEYIELRVTKEDLVAFFFYMLIGSLIVVPLIRWAMQPKRARVENFLVWYAAMVVILVGVVYQIASPSDAFDTWRRPVILALGLGLLLFAAVRFRQGVRILLGVALASLLITIAETPYPRGLVTHYVLFLLAPLIVGAVLWLNGASRLSLYFLLLAASGPQLAFEFSRSNLWVGTPPIMPMIRPGEVARLLPREIVALPPENPVIHDITQAVRYLEVLEKTPAAIDPLRTYPRDRTSLKGTDFSQIRSEGVWNSFAYYRHYARLVFSGLDSRILERIFLVGELPLQFLSNWVTAPDFEAYMGGLGVERALALLDTTVVVADGAGVEVPAQQNQAPRTSVRVLDYTYDLLAAEVLTDGPGILYFADGFDPDWKASVNGVSVPILRANGNFKAVAIPKGRSTVIFEYSPVMFVGAIRIFQATFIIGLLFIFVAPFADKIGSLRPMSRS